MKKLHESIRAKIEKANDSYKRKANKHRRKTEFQQGDLVWVNLRKERFPSKRKSKLAPRADDPFEVLERVGDNAYKIKLPGDYGVSATFNIGDLSPFVEDEYISDLRSNPNPPGENDPGGSAMIQEGVTAQRTLISKCGPNMLQNSFGFLNSSFGLTTLIWTQRLKFRPHKWRCKFDVQIQ
ncbi:hypothetical protein CFOL_v3_17191 [Cephalotus follicularis]|uniref:Tf2-1-like SH3-like domain-containing protein n=1 Tax=Cephalotus follicularis TaxID=3775 RepID=A0A1Q3C0R6_CEPFO|nr:hypothetical protein CFOL_v3_17191 [Cephalotus follicularis]